MNCLLELHYLPCIAYFTCIAKAQHLILEKHEHYIKQSYRNRCLINTAHGFERLTIPLTAKHGKVSITDIKIDYTQKWLNTHWRAIESAYRKSPFFEYYADDLQAIMFRKNTFLYELNYELLTICLKWLNLDITIQETSAYRNVPEEGQTDLRNHIHPKKPLALNKFFKPVTYRQVFGKSFVENLSIADLVFCEGPQARNIVLASATPNEHLK